MAEITHLIRVRNTGESIKPVFYSHCPLYANEDVVEKCFNGQSYCGYIREGALIKNLNDEISLLQCNYGG